MPTAFDKLYGRNKELSKINACLKNGTNIISFIAFGGYGKTALVKEWVRSIREKSILVDEKLQYEHIYIWSFYAQGLRIGNASSDDFFYDAFKYFGSEVSEDITAAQKGNTLAQLVSQKKAIIILDGFEVFQSPPGINEGHIRDNALHIFLRALANENNGLCILTSRIGFPQLKEFTRNKAYIEYELNGLEPKKGAEYLRSLGIKGSENDLRETSCEYRGHCLSLALLSTVLNEVYDGNITSRKLIRNQLFLQSNETEHTNNILECYSEWLHENKKIEYLEILNILALFDRAIDRTCLKYIHLRGKQFSANLCDLSFREIHQILKKLHSSKLVFLAETGIDFTLDTHPIIRSYFSNRLKAEHPELWREGNSLVYSYLTKDIPEYPSSVNDMELLLRAVNYGIEFKDVNIIFDDIYKRRIMRNNMMYAAQSLGMYGAVLSSISAFFVEGNWELVNPNLNAKNKNDVLVEAGQHLTSVMGYSSPDAAICYEEVANGSNFLGDQYDNCYITAILGLCRYYRMIGNLSATKKFSDILVKISNSVCKYKTVAYRALCTYYFYHGDLNMCIKEADNCEKEYDSNNAVELANLDLNEPYLSCLGYKCMAMYLQGEKDTQIKEIIEESYKFNHTHTLVVMLLMQIMIEQYANNYKLVNSISQEMIEICADNGFNQWECSAKILQYWSAIHLENRNGRKFVKYIEYQIDLWKSFGAKLFLPYWYLLLADGCHSCGILSEYKKYMREARNIQEKTTEYWALKYVLPLLEDKWKER